MSMTLLLFIGFLAAAAAIAGAVFLTDAPGATRFVLGLMGGALLALLLWIAGMVVLVGPQIPDP